MAGAAAMAKPPRPPVSVMALSPMSGLASALVKPAKYSASGTSAGAVNHRSPVPASWTPKSVPLRAMTTAMELPLTPRAASSVALQAGIERFRKKWSLPLMKLSTATASSLFAQVATMAGARAR